MTGKPDTLRSFIRDCAVRLRVGVYPSEKRAPQTVIVNIEIEAAAAPRFDDPAEESLNRVIDYAAVHHFVARELPKMDHIPLLETVAEMIIDFCFRDPRIANVRVRLEKPTILPDAAGAGDRIVPEQGMSGRVLITGGAKRIGRAIALEMAAAGWDIILHYNTARRDALKTAKEIKKLGRDAYLAELDLSNAWLVGKLIPALVAELGPIMALVNNASLFLPDRLDPGNRQEKVNAEAPWILSEAFYQHIGRGREGAIVNLLDADPSTPGFSRYNESKKILNAMTHRMAENYAPQIRVNGLALGPVLRNSRQSTGHFRKLVQKTSLGKAATPEDVAHAARFLIENKSITGAIIPLGAALNLKE